MASYERPPESDHRNPTSVYLQVMQQGEAPPRKGDVLSWRGQTFTVRRVYKWRIHLDGSKNNVRVSCLKPIAEGGFSEAMVVQRVTR